MAKYPIENPTKFTETAEKLTTETKAHADNFNRLFESLFNNDAFLKEEVDETKKATTEHVKDSDIHVTKEMKSEWSAKAGTSVATTSMNGLMSNTDKAKLDTVGSKAEENQNAFSNVKVGSVTVVANTKAAQVEFVAGKNVTLTADNATKKVVIEAELTTEKMVDGVALNGTDSVIHYGVCQTVAGTAAKTVGVTGFKLVSGASVKVKFVYTNTSAAPTLNVNNVGAKPICCKGEPIQAGFLAANAVCEFLYDGTNYELVVDGSKAGTSVATPSTDGLMSNTDKAKLDTVGSKAEENQNAFSNVKVGSVTVAASAKTATMEIAAGENVTITADNTNKKITISTEGGGSHIGTSAPAKTNMLWIDTTNGSVLKFYNGTGWVPVKAVWG